MRSAKPTASSARYTRRWAARVITGHCRLADKVYSTTYESGKRILVNYADTAYTVEGVTVPAHGYAIV